MSVVFSEVCQLSDKDCFLIVERHKKQFTYPLHKHPEFELNFIQNGAGVMRVIGDSRTEISDLELVLVGGENLEHAWEQHKCRSEDIREITVQFSPTLLGEDLLGRNQFASIRKMMEKAKMGIAFPKEAILKVYSLLEELPNKTHSFEQFVDFLVIMNKLAEFDVKPLATSIYATPAGVAQSRRISLAKDYILMHFAEDIQLETIAALAGMSPSSFSRFFRQKTGSTVSNYIISARLGYADRLLLNTDRSISDICFSCGFNNLSNLNRIFKDRKGMNPREYRKTYAKKATVV